MSSQQEVAAIQAALDAIAQNYVLIISLALLAYDTILTFRYEMEYVWQKKLTLGNVLYLISRYPVLVLFVIDILQTFLNVSVQSCSALYHLGDALDFLPTIGVQGLLLVRAYAISKHKGLVLAALAVLGGCNIILYLPGAISDGCNISNPIINTADIIIINNTQSIVTVLYDIIVTVLTLINTVGTWRLYQRSTWQTMSLAHLLAQQSLVRFGFVLILTFGGTVMDLAVATPRPTLLGISGCMQNSLSTILICRFHLDLQRAYTHPNSSNSRSIPSITLESFRVAAQSIHDAVVTEFSDPIPETVWSGSESSRGEVVIRDTPEAATGEEIELTELQHNA